jgi:hypothetical protein
MGFCATVALFFSFDFPHERDARRAWDTYLQLSIQRRRGKDAGA